MWFTWYHPFCQQLVDDGGHSGPLIGWVVVELTLDSNRAGGLAWPQHWGQFLRFRASRKRGNCTFFWQARILCVIARGAIAGTGVDEGMRVEPRGLGPSRHVTLVCCHVYHSSKAGMWGLRVVLVSLLALALPHSVALSC